MLDVRCFGIPLLHGLSITQVDVPRLVKVDGIGKVEEIRDRIFDGIA